MWTLSKPRRAGGARAAGFPGDEILFHRMANGVSRRFVGIRAEGRAPVRAGAKLVDGEDRSIGTVTSGGFGATVGGPVAMGCLASRYCQPDTLVHAMVRGRRLPMRAVKLPFVERRYHRS